MKSGKYLVKFYANGSTGISFISRIEKSSFYSLKYDHTLRQDLKRSFSQKKKKKKKRK